MDSSTLNTRADGGRPVSKSRRLPIYRLIMSDLCELGLIPPETLKTLCKGDPVNVNTLASAARAGDEVHG